jgi:hypothetical protein
MAATADKAAVRGSEFARQNLPYIQSPKACTEWPESRLSIGGINGPFGVESGHRP